MAWLQLGVESLSESLMIQFQNTSAWIQSLEKNELNEPCLLPSNLMQYRPAMTVNQYIAIMLTNLQSGWVEYF